MSTATCASVRPLSSADVAAVDLSERVRGCLLNRIRSLCMDRPQDADVDDLASEALLGVLAGLKSGRYAASALPSLIWHCCRAVLTDWVESRVAASATSDCDLLEQRSSRCPDCAGTGDEHWVTSYDVEWVEYTVKGRVCCAITNEQEHAEPAHCETCKGTGEVFATLPEHFIASAYGDVDPDNSREVTQGKQRQAIALVLSRGFTVSDTARLLKINRTTVYRHLDQLRSLLWLFDPDLDQNAVFHGDNRTQATSVR